MPNDRVVRGSTALHQPRDVTSMVSVAFEGMCSVSAAQVVHDHSAQRSILGILRRRSS